MTRHTSNVINAVLDMTSSNNATACLCFKRHRLLALRTVSLCVIFSIKTNINPLMAAPDAQCGVPAFIHFSINADF